MHTSTCKGIRVVLLGCSPDDRLPLVHDFEERDGSGVNLAMRDDE